jgi:hypothetical protein
MKYSYTVNGEDRTAVASKDGRIMEVRRGDLTGSALLAAGRRAWGSEAEWKAELPSGTVIERSSPRLTPNPRLNLLLEQCSGGLRIYDTVRSYSDAERLATQLKNMKAMVEQTMPKYREYYNKRIEEWEAALQAASTERKYYRTCYDPLFYCEQGDGVQPVYINRSDGLILCIDKGRWVEPPVGATFWIPSNGGYRKVVIDEAVEETHTVYAEPVYIPSPIALYGFEDSDNVMNAKKRKQMLAGLSFFLLMAYRLYKK